MEMIFDDLINVKGVLGVLVVSPDRNILFRDLEKLKLDELKEEDFEIPFLLFDRIKEIDLLFDHFRIYIRRCPLGFLLVIMDEEAPAAMIRLQCDLIVPKMEQQRSAKKGIGRLFK